MRHIAYQQWDCAASFTRGHRSGTVVVEDSLRLGTPRSTFRYTDPFVTGTTAEYDVGTWTSPCITTAFPYTELIPSWNAHTPDGTWIQVSVRGSSEDGAPSKAYILGRWAEDTSAIHRTSVPAQGGSLATVSVDTLIARRGRTLSSWQLSVSLFRVTGTETTPSVDLIGAMVSALPDVAQVEVSSFGGAARDLDVPAYSQEIHRGHHPAYNHGGEAWCSPTSIAMILDYWRRVDPTYGPPEAAYSDFAPPDPWVDYAAASTFDWSYDGAGNWPFNTAYAGRFGLESFVTRLRSLGEAERFIGAGVPLIVSVSFGEGELSGSGYGTDGHLMVIRGFTASGDVIVNDPASHLDPDNASVRAVYDRTEFENVWIPRSGGIAYVIHPRSVPLPAPDPSTPANW